MARIRTLKPSFFRSRSLARCSRDARLTFQGLWVEADDCGRGIADPRVLKGAIWPLDDDVTADDVRHHMSELVETGHIRLYQVGEEDFYEIANWEEHQAAAYRRGSATFPAPFCTSLHDEKCKKVLEGNKEGNKEGQRTRADARTNGFAAFWSAYPRKVGKPRAERAFENALGLAPMNEIMGGLENWTSAWSSERTPEKFIPHASTWLNDQRWKDPAPKVTAGPDYSERAVVYR